MTGWPALGEELAGFRPLAEMAGLLDPAPGRAHAPAPPELRLAAPLPGWTAGARALAGGRSAMIARPAAGGPRLLDWTFLGDPCGDGLLEGRRLPGGAWRARLRDLAPVAYLQHVGVLAAGPGDEVVVCAHVLETQRDVLARWLETDLLPAGRRAAVHVLGAGGGPAQPWLRAQPAAILAAALVSGARLELTPLGAYLRGERRSHGRAALLAWLRERTLVSVFATRHHDALRQAGVRCLPGPLLARFSARGFLHLLRERGILRPDTVPSGGVARSPAEAGELLDALEGRFPVFLKGAGLGGDGVVRAGTRRAAALAVRPLLTLGALERALRGEPGDAELEVAEDVHRRLPSAGVVEFNLQVAVRERPPSVVPQALAVRHRDGLAYSWGPAGDDLLDLVDARLGGPMAALAGALAAAGPGPHVLSVEGLAAPGSPAPGPCLIEANLRAAGPAQLALVRERLGERLDAEPGAAHRVFNVRLPAGGPDRFRRLDEEAGRHGCRCVPLGRETAATVKLLVLARRAAGSDAACTAAVRGLRALVG